MKKIRTRKRGTKWYFSFEAGKKPNGKRNTIEKGGFSDEDSAYDAGLIAYNQWKYGISCTDHNRITLLEFMQNWLEYCRARVRSNTLANYRTLVSAHLGFFGSTLLADLTPMQCDAWIQDLISKKYAAKTITTLKTTLGIALQYAVYPCQLIPSNPILKLRMPKTLKRPVVKREVISLERYQNFLDKYPEDSGIHIPACIAFHTGMRVSEILGLLWDNVDLVTGVIHVRTQTSFVNNIGRFLTHNLKTPRSQRDIPIDSKLCSILREWKHTQFLNSIIRGDTYLKNYIDEKGLIHCGSSIALEAPYCPIEPVCTNSEGRVISTVHFMHILKREGLNCHSFRHTHATMLLEAGVPATEIASRLGHSKVDITLGVYVHSTKDMQIKAKDAFEKLLEQNNKSCQHD